MIQHAAPNNMIHFNCCFQEQSGGVVVEVDRTEDSRRRSGELKKIRNECLEDRSRHLFRDV